MSLLLRRYHAKAEPSGVEVPGGSASKKAWTEYALAEGKSAEELDGLTRDQIRDSFATPETPDADKQQDGDTTQDSGADKAPEDAGDGEQGEPDKGADKTE